VSSSPTTTLAPSAPLENAEPVVNGPESEPAPWNDTVALWLSVVACALALGALCVYVALAVRVGGVG
jgi:hypothetical protein